MKMYIIGAGGHAKVVADAIESKGETLLGFLEDDPARETLLGYPVYAFNAQLPRVSHAVIAIGDNAARKRIGAEHALTYERVIHSSAVISKHTGIGEGSMIMANAVVNPGSVIGRHVIINTSASIDHDCIIGDFAHISPNATLSGNVEVGEGTWIGAGAVVIQGVKIGAWSVIGAGSVVTRDIPDGVVAYGNPCRVMRKLD